MGDRIKDLFQLILASDDRLAVWDHALELCDLFGCDLVQADFGDTSVDYRMNQNVFSNYPLWYYEQYAVEGLWSGDDVEDHVLSGNRCPLVFGFEVEKWAASPSARKLNDICVSFGLRVGVSFPIEGPVPDLTGVVNFGLNGTAEQFERVLGRNAHLMALCAQAIHVRLQGLLSRRRSRSKVAGLTAREHDVLRFLAAGLSFGQVAERLRISEATVRFHLIGAKQKLGVATTAQAVVAVAQAQVAQGPGGLPDLGRTPAARSTIGRLHQADAPPMQHAAGTETWAENESV